MKKISKDQIKLIHVLKNNLKYDDKKYQELLMEKFGVSSSKELTSQQAESFIKTLRTLFEKGFKASPKQIGKVKSLVEKLYPVETVKKLNELLESNLGKGKRLENIDKKEASKIIYQLEEVEKWKKSKGK
ncbi:DUF1018 domain-containing protein [Cetobacterium somerae]|uniref:regulatory protein GemA n=1 Tax=Cetobacterium TaxID=180162 RepID=UPI00211ECF17|nr:regulatory protein GemA [Cetobacterium somerae]MCQ9626889.1 DUF1018 domain-containing protein [Cetobacterium somerae]